MSGYLHRLAERSLSTASRIHSLATRPYASLQSPAEGETLVEAMNAEQPKGRELSVLSRLRRDVRSLTPVAQSPHHEAPSGRASDEPIGIGVTPASPAGQDVTALSSEILSEPSETQPSSQERQSPSVLQVARSVRPSLDETGSRRDDVFVPLVKAGEPSNQIAPVPVVSFRNRTSPFPGELERPRPVSRIMGRRLPEPPGAEPNEVHVTIGRIEITAIHAPPLPKAAPPPVRKPTPLDEHLAERNRKRS
jgi:hypothetical protein